MGRRGDGDFRYAICDLGLVICDFPQICADGSCADGAEALFFPCKARRDAISFTQSCKDANFSRKGAKMQRDLTAERAEIFFAPGRFFLSREGAKTQSHDNSSPNLTRLQRVSKRNAFITH